MLPADEADHKEFLVGLVRAMYDELPVRKRKRRNRKIRFAELSKRKKRPQKRQTALPQQTNFAAFPHCA